MTDPFIILTRTDGARVAMLTTDVVGVFEHEGRTSVIYVADRRDLEQREVSVTDTLDSIVARLGGAPRSTIAGRALDLLFADVATKAHALGAASRDGFVTDGARSEIRAAVRDGLDHLARQGVWYGGPTSVDETVAHILSALPGSATPEGVAAAFGAYSRGAVSRLVITDLVALVQA